MAGADSCAVVPMKIFIKEDEITPMRVLLEFFRAAIERALTIAGVEKNVCESPGDFRRRRPQVHFPAGPCREFDFVFIAEIVVELL